MFERRLRLFLLFVFLFGMVLAVRAAQIQLVDRNHWNELAAANASRVQYLPAKRGDLLDYRGRVIAHDLTGFDVAVNFRAIPSVPDSEWLQLEATRRARLLPEYQNAADADAKALVIAQETQHVRADLDAMWDTIARLTGTPRATIDETRREVEADVKGKHAAFVQRRYQDALDAYEHAPPAPWYIRLIAGRPERPELETIERDSTVDDEETFHTIVADVTPDASTQLALLQESFPQFRDLARRWQSVVTIRPSIRREYPYHDVAAHVIGHVGVVSAEDRDSDPNKDDERRRYALVDRIGRDGLERLAEQELRGSRGQRVSDRRGDSVSVDDADAGKAVRSSIDIDLQHEIQGYFNSVDYAHYEKDASNKQIHQTLAMHGAAVVIDIATGQVRALVSVPSFDINQFDELYPQLSTDDLNRPLANRALLDAVEPGSSVKPIIGLGAVTQHLFSTTDTVRCEGHATLTDSRGRTLVVEHPACWTWSIHRATHMTLNHPPASPDLTLTQAIQRSCNVYFLTLGDKLGIDGESYWMKQFGLGQISGIGLPENRGLVPSMARLTPDVQRSSSWYAAIGQGPIAATPIQICNEMATIARNGVWVRPRLLVDVAPPPTTRPDGSYIPDRVDLHLDPTALAAVHQGMFDVVNTLAGTGTQVHLDNVDVCAKTGSATAQPLSHPRRDAEGNLVKDDKGNVLYDFIPYGHLGQPNAELPWYFRSGVDDKGRDKGTHSWVSGYAPADHPQIAFAVYVEYGGSGGIGAGSIGKRLLQACIAHGYLSTKPGTTTTPATIDQLQQPPAILQSLPDPATGVEPINTED